MARSKIIAVCLAILLPAVAAGQATPVPTDIPWAVNVSDGTIKGDDGVVWSADAGVYLNEPARKAEKDALQALRDQNADLTKRIQEAQAETEAYKITPEGWVGIATSIIGTVGAAVAAVVAATQKH